MTTVTPQQLRDIPAPDALSPTNLDGHTIAELSAYLDAERTPTNFSIESSPGCQIALAALKRLGELTVDALETQAVAELPPDGLVQGVMDRIVLDAHADHGSPAPPAPAIAHLALSKNAVRGMIRAAGDSLPAVIVGRCQLEGEVAGPGEPITVTVDISVAWGENLHDAADRVRAAIHRQLLEHTELTVAAIHINVQDVRFVEDSGSRITSS